MSMRAHDPYDELISSSLTGELTEAERATLDAHLDGCAECRAALASYAEGRRIVAGLRHVAPPRDLGARVRAGIERGAFAPLPWWRRPVPLFATIGGGLAAVAGALLALVLLNGPSDDPPAVGASQTVAPSPTVSVSTSPEATVAPTAQPAPQVTLPPVVTDPSASASPAPSPDASASPAPTTAPTATRSPQPDLYLAVTGEVDNLALSFQEPQPESPTPAPVMEVPEVPSGPPVAAELSPDGAWMAYVTQVGQRGVNEVRVTRVSPPDEGSDEELPLEEAQTLVLGESLPGGAFLERLVWSDDSRRLAFTLASPDDGATDVWIYDTSADAPVQLTDDGTAHAASWVPAGEDDADAPPRLWVSLAGETPTSYLVELPADGALETVDVTEDPLAEAAQVFLPILSPNGSLAIYWTGSMSQGPDGTWLMAEMGRPFLAEHDLETFDFGNERRLFSDLADDRDMLSSAAIAWGPDGDSYAVWETQWTGVDQGTEGEPYPDPTRVYFGHATDARGLTRTHALDRDDLPDDGSVVDVKVAPTGRHLAITVQRPVAGDLSAPRADLILVTRNTGNVADEVQPLGWDPEEGWFGPATYAAPTEDDGGS